MAEMEFPVIVFHNISSSKNCSEFIKIAAGMGFKTLVITHAQGSAAQRGLPAAQKIALKLGVNFIVLYNLDDVNELFNPDLMIVVAPPPYGQQNLTHELLQEFENKRWVVVFGGNDPGLSRQDLEKGDKVVQVPAGDIGSLGTLTLGLAILTGKFGFTK